MDAVFKEAYGSSNNAWRSCIHRVREELGVEMSDKSTLDLNQSTTEAEGRPEEQRQAAADTVMEDV